MTVSKIKDGNQACAFYNAQNRTCTATTRISCSECNFMKTPGELSSGRARARALLYRLPQEAQNAIVDKYYIQKRRTAKGDAP